MKKWISSLLIAMLLFTSLAIEKTNASSTASVKIDGKVVASIPPPVESNDTIMFPLAEIFKAAGFETETVTENNTLTARVYYTDVVFGASVGKSSFGVYDRSGDTLYRTVSMTKAATQIGSNSVGVPLDYIKNTIGLDITWNQTYSVLTINTKASKHYLFNDDTAHGMYLKINNTQMMAANYEAFYNVDIDDSGNTAPIVEKGTTLVPISKLIIELGGNVSWDQAEKKVTAELNGNKVQIWIGKSSANVNGSSKTLSVPAKTINGRTMIPLRFISENLGLNVIWHQDTSTIALYRPWFKEEMLLDPYGYVEWFDSNYDLVEFVEPPMRPVPDNIDDESGLFSDPNTPYDSDGNIVHVGDVVSVGMFSGDVLQVNGNKILVYWGYKSFLVPNGDEEFWALISGIRYKNNTWIEASEVSVTSSGY